MLQLGADSLSGDKIGGFNMTLDGKSSIDTILAES